MFLRSLFHPHRTLSLRAPWHRQRDKHPCSAVGSGESRPFLLGIDHSFINNPGTPPEPLVDAVHRSKQLLPIECELLGQGDLKILGSRPVDAGGFANVWKGKKKDGTMVALKSYRYYSSSSCLPVYARFCKEAMTYGRLGDSNGNIVSLIGVYSTLEHPLALVFEFMDHANLREYLRENPDTRRMGLILDIAHGLSHMHGLGIVHGNLRITNILVSGDRHAHIAGLGTATVIDMPAMEIDRSFYGVAPELTDPRRQGPADHGATRASDVYAFAVLTWEIFAGQSPFANENVITAVNSMLNGRRPRRPNHPELSNRVWRLIRGCWKGDPAQRRSMAEVMSVLAMEVNCRQSG